MSLVLIGFMGSGKTTVGRLLDADCYDLDAAIVEKIGMPIADFFERYGENAFREVETQVLAQALQAQRPVIATGGGVVLRAENRALLAKNEQNIFLNVDFETLYDRIGKDTQQVRPLFQGLDKAAFKAVYDQRQPLYQEVATRTLDVVGQSPEEIVEWIG